MDILKNSNGTKFVFTSSKGKTFSPKDQQTAQRHIEEFGGLICDPDGNLIADEKELMLIENEFVGTDPSEMYNDATDLATRFLSECNPNWNKGVPPEEEAEIIALFAMKIAKDASLQKELLDYLNDRGIQLLLSPVGIQYHYL